MATPILSGLPAADRLLRNVKVAEGTAQVGAPPAPGVAVQHCWWGVDVYRGSIDALLGLGMVRAHEIPGALGAGSTMCSYGPDGKRIPRGAAGGKRCPPGHRQIRRVGKDRLRVEVTVGGEEQARRREAEVQRLEREDFLDALRRSTEARARAEEAGVRRAHLRLVWSAPTAS
jgi:hypothetical protein